MRGALAFGVADVDTIVVALAGFLLRGGILLLLLPSIVLPSVINIAGATGVKAFGIDGQPQPWLFEVAAVISALAALWLVLAFVLGALIDFWLVHAALDPEGHATGRPRPLPDLRIVLDLAGIRALCLVPLVAAVIWAGSQIYTAAYQELTTPTSLATPLALRVIESAAVAVVVVGLAWLASEVVAAIAVRRLILLDVGIWRSIGGALIQIVRRPVSSVATVVVSFIGSVLAMGLAMAATAMTFDWCRVVARDQQPISVTIGISPISTTRDFRPAVFILAAVALVLAWVAALALSGIASAWRSAAFTGETAAAAPEAQPDSAEVGLGLSGLLSDRSGD